MMTARALLLSLAVLTGAMGCSRQDSADGRAQQARAQGAAGDEAATGEKLKFKDAEDRERFSLKPKADGAKLVDGEDRELARYKWKGVSLKVSGPDDTVLGWVVSSAGGAFTVRDAEQRQTLFTLARQGAGWRLNDVKGAPLYLVSQDGEGVTISDASGTELARVKAREGKVSLRDATGRTLLASKSGVRAEAAACLAFERLDMPLRMALLFTLQSPPEGAFR